MSEIECSRNILWNGRWQRVDTVELELQTQHRERFRQTVVNCCSGEKKTSWVYTKVVYMRKYGRNAW
jgi:hypothetical protein